MSVMIFGKVKWFDRNKGYGFINFVKPLLTGQFSDEDAKLLEAIPEAVAEDGTGVGTYDIFVHYSHINSPFAYKALVEGEKVYFSLGASPNGSPMAVNVIPSLVKETTEENNLEVDE